MIMPVYDDYGIAKGCYVHDMILDLICSLSSEDNFVTVLNGTAHSMSSRSNVRRLSLQNVIGELQTTLLRSVNMLKVRSIATYKTAIDLMPSVSRFVVLRVLDLRGCNLSDHDHLDLGDLGSLLHLRYLDLTYTRISELPEVIGNLQFLEVLKVSNNHLMKVPSTIIKLRRLRCLIVDYDHKLPDGLGNLTSLEVLDGMSCFSPSTVKELGSMEMLRTLGILFEDMSLEMEETFVESLGKMSNIQNIEIDNGDVEDEDEDDAILMDFLGERWVAPRTLQKFISNKGIIFSILPAWIRSHMSQLCTLDIWVEEVQQEDLDILGSLPGLCHLVLWSTRPSRLLLVTADGFPSLKRLELMPSSPGQVVVQPGALLKIENIQLNISLRVAKEEAAGNGGNLVCLYVGNLPSLRNVTIILDRSGVTVGEAKQEKAALEMALRTHPMRPRFFIDMVPEIRDGT
jgi:hypothetical protein